MKPLKNIGELMKSTAVYRDSEVRRLCDGCAGEQAINEGDTMLEVTDVNGVKTRYCTRCYIALNVKMRVRADHQCFPYPGAFTWAKLSNAFKKAWTSLVIELDARDSNNHPEVLREAFGRFFHGMNIDPDDVLDAPGLATVDETAKTDDAAAAAKAKRHEQYIRRKEARMKKEQDEIRRLAADLSALKQTVAGKAAELARHFLAAKVAHIRGEKAKYDEAHGASAAILVELQRLAEVTA